MGLVDFIANYVDRYVELAKNIASEIDFLQDVRQGLRARLQGSPLCDGKSFACDIEAAYKDILNKCLKDNEAKKV